MRASRLYCFLSLNEIAAPFTRALHGYTIGDVGDVIVPLHASREVILIQADDDGFEGIRRCVMESDDLASAHLICDRVDLRIDLVVDPLRPVAFPGAPLSRGCPSRSLPEGRRHWEVTPTARSGISGTAEGLGDVCRAVGRPGGNERIAAARALIRICGISSL